MCDHEIGFPTVTKNIVIDLNRQISNQDSRLFDLKSLIKINKTAHILITTTYLRSHKLRIHSP